MNAHPHYTLYVPNGNNVFYGGQLVAAIGHHRHSGHGERNIFGRDFQLHGFRWTEDFCQLDSDGDGRSNGEELGDPFCVWSRGRTPYRSSQITHPGLADSVADIAEEHTNPQHQSNLNAFPDNLDQINEDQDVDEAGWDDDIDDGAFTEL